MVDKFFQYINFKDEQVSLIFIFWHFQIWQIISLLPLLPFPPFPFFLSYKINSFVYYVCIYVLHGCTSRRQKTSYNSASGFFLPCGSRIQHVFRLMTSTFTPKPSWQPRLWFSKLVLISKINNRIE